MIPQSEILRMAVQSVAYEFAISRRRGLRRLSMETMQLICEDVETRLRETGLWGFMVDYSEILPEHIVGIIFRTDVEEWHRQLEQSEREEEYWEDRDAVVYWENIRHLNY